MEKSKTTGFVDEVVQEMYEIVGNDLPEETKEKLAVSIGLSLKQSFLNGIEVGLKKRRERTGQAKQKALPKIPQVRPREGRGGGLALSSRLFLF